MLSLTLHSSSLRRSRLVLRVHLGPKAKEKRAHFGEFKEDPTQNPPNLCLLGIWLQPSNKHTTSAISGTMFVIS